MRLRSGEQSRRERWQSGEPCAPLLKVAVNIHDLTGLEISCLHIERVEKEHPSAIKDASIAVVQSIDRGIELIVAANRGQKKFVRLQVMFRDWANGQLRLAGTCFEVALPCCLLDLIGDISLASRWLKLEIPQLPWKSRHGSSCSPPQSPANLWWFETLKSPSPDSQRSLRRSTVPAKRAERSPGSRLMMPMESSMVRNCLPVLCISSSVRPRQGRISALSPVIR